MKVNIDIGTPEKNILFIFLLIFHIFSIENIVKEPSENLLLPNKI